MNSKLTQNIWAVGRNYIDHAKEMNAEIPKEPFFFLKSGNCLETSSHIKLPIWSNDVHHEIEIAFRVDENLELSHFTLALDLTARDAQSLAKSKGLPWTQAKSFRGACPIGSWISLSDIQNILNLNFQLVVNQKTVQQGQLKNSVFKPQDLLNYVKNYYPLCAHDIILTGTPAGVGPINSGDSLLAQITYENRQILACHWDVI